MKVNNNMMKNEELLNRRMGKKNPFTVPDGYFEQFTQQLMQMLPETPAVSHLSAEPAPAERPTVFRRLRPWLLAAACTGIALFSVSLLFNHANQGTDSAQALTAIQQQDNNTYYSDTYIDEAADYAMVDNQEIYAYLLAEM